MAKYSAIFLKNFTAVEAETTWNLRSHRRRGLESVDGRKKISLFFVFRVGCSEQFKNLILLKEFSNFITYTPTDTLTHTHASHIPIHICTNILGT